MVQSTYIGDYKLEYESEAREGVYYLRDHLERSESKVFFEMAKRNKSANFEDKSSRNFTLWHKEGNVFILTRRKD